METETPTDQTTETGRKLTTRIFHASLYALLFLLLWGILAIGGHV